MAATADLLNDAAERQLNEFVPNHGTPPFAGAQFPDALVFLRRHFPHFGHAQPLSAEFPFRFRRALPRHFRLLKKFRDTVRHPCFSVRDYL
jgi:hypothetical protein